MELKFTLKNYRCFSANNPARFTIKDGFTAFTGINNAGKSALLRFFYEFRNIFFTLSSRANFISYLTGRNQLIGINGVAVQGNMSYFRANTPDSDPMGIFNNTNDTDIRVEIEIYQEAVFDSRYGVPLILHVEIVVPREINKFWSFSIKVGNHYVSNVEELSIDENDLIKRGVMPIGHAGQVLDVFSALSDMFYIGPFRNALNVTTDNSYYDIIVGQPLISSWRQWQSGISIFENEAIYKLSNDIKMIFRFDVLQIFPSQNNETFQIVLDGKSYKLQELGTGLAQFILVLANVATRNRKPSFILIDEPELNLHPSLQLDFLTTLTSYATNGVIFTTHSIGLARTIANPIYTVSMNQGGIRAVNPLETTPDWAKFIGEMSFSGNSELGFDTLLLVEGKHDVPAIQQFLRMLKKDHRVLVFPIGGSQLINGNSGLQLSEAKRITERIFVLIDSEKLSEDYPLEQRIVDFANICAKLSIPLLITERRAIENYLTDRALKKVKGPKYHGLSEFKALNGQWGKEENWRIAREMTLEELMSTDIGKYLGKL